MACLDDQARALRQQRIARLRTLLATPPGLTGAPMRLSAMAAQGLPPIEPLAVLSRLQAQLDALPAPAPAGTAAFDQARSVLLAQAASALQHLAQTPVGQPVAGPNGDLLASLEAIVIADGSRPSFLLSGGQLPEARPLAGPWQSALGAPAFNAALPALARAVGRIQPGGGGAGRFIGTGTLVDAAAGLVLTNHHVVEQARHEFGVSMTDDGAGRLRVDGTLEIDFAAEDGLALQQPCRVVAVLLPAQAGSGPGQLDAAVLRLAPLPGQADGWPTQAVPLVASAGAASQAGDPLFTIGFPDEPRRIAPAGALIDWDFVIGTLFGKRFGVKQLAPGQRMPSTDPALLLHDATVFGGASGSLLFGLVDGRLPVLGLHFAGATGTANQALPMARLALALSALGVPVAAG